MRIHTHVHRHTLQTLHLGWLLQFAPFVRQVVVVSNFFMSTILNLIVQSWIIHCALHCISIVTNSYFILSASMPCWGRFSVASISYRPWICWTVLKVSQASKAQSILEYSGTLSFLKVIKCETRMCHILKHIHWVVPPPSNSHHQDYYSFSRGSL